MSVYKRYKGKKITAKDPNWSKGTWYIYKRIRGGKIIHKSVPEADTKEKAQIAERKEIERVFNRRYGIQDDSITFSAFCDTTYKKYVRQNNVNIYVKDIFIKELKKFFGKKLLIEITPQDCRDFQHSRSVSKTKHGDKRSPSSVNKETSTLSKIFTLACEEGLLDRNPMQYVKKLTEPPPRKRLLAAKEKAALWKQIEADEFLYSVVTLAVNLPLRRGQILAITKEAIDFDKKILLAASSKGRPPRVVPLNEKAMSVLRPLCDAVNSGEILLLKGKPVKDFRKRWQTALVNAGINKQIEIDGEKKNDKRENNFHFHDCRKWFATELIRRNVNPNIVQKLFAHSTMEITNIYTDADEEMLFDAVNVLDDTVTEIEGMN